MHHIVWPRHLHHTDVVLYHVYLALVLSVRGLGLQLLSLESKLEFYYRVCLNFRDEFVSVCVF